MHDGKRLGASFLFYRRALTASFKLSMAQASNPLEPKLLIQIVVKSDLQNIFDTSRGRNTLDFMLNVRKTG
jgi:hypothetical protein